MFLEFLETLLVGVLFIIYLLLWRTKRMILKKKTGIDPEVIAKSKSNLQSLMNIMFKAITFYVILIIVFHTSKLNIFELIVRNS